MSPGEPKPRTRSTQAQVIAAAAGAGASTEQSDEVRAFFQHRVGMFGRGATAFGLGFLVFRAVIVLLDRSPSDLFEPTMSLHALGATAALALWLSCRTGVRSVAVIRWIEVAGLLVMTGAYCAMGAHMPFHDSPHYVVLVALMILLVARAIYIPSSARRTMFVGVLVGVPYLLMVAASANGIEPAKWAQLNPDLLTRSSRILVVMAVTWSAVWWLFVVLTTAAASRVVYGLRREARNARKLGQYTLDDKIGEGGMGVVYRARHGMLLRPTAIKLLPVDKAGAQNIARFEREVRHTARLTHANTITIFDYGRTPDGVFYYAMELLNGATLSDLVELDGAQSAGRVLHILAQAAGSLSEAHAANLIHRDIKPSNIMLVDRGGVPDVVKVLDFGLVKEINDDTSVSLTTAGALTGTPQYLSPEAIRSADAVDARSDLYALGAVGYYLLTGQPVFSGQTVIEVCSQHLHSQPVPPSEHLDSPVTPDLEELLLACLAKDPADRPQTAAELQGRLRACVDAPAWTDAIARDWWDLYGDRVQARRRAEVSATNRTIDIDMLRRSPSA